MWYDKTLVQIYSHTLWNELTNAPKRLHFGINFSLHIAYMFIEMKVLVNVETEVLKFHHSFYIY